jgi:ABC-type transporter Mla subunit MlaD
MSESPEARVRHSGRRLLKEIKILITQAAELTGAFARLHDLMRAAHKAAEVERKLVATLQNLADAIAQQGTVVQEEAQEVADAIAGLNQAIEDLKGQGQAALDPIVAQLEANTKAISDIFTPGPTPAPLPAPDPGPQGRRH